jgi:hypothetical protein
MVVDLRGWAWFDYGNVAGAKVSDMIMRFRVLFLVSTLACFASHLLAQAPASIDTTRLGPQIGAVVPPITGVDQFGRPQTLGSIYGPKGAMVVFYRSASW